MKINIMDLDPEIAKINYCLDYFRYNINQLSDYNDINLYEIVVDKSPNHKKKINNLHIIKLIRERDQENLISLIYKDCSLRKIKKKDAESIDKSNLTNNIFDINGNYYCGGIYSECSSFYHEFNRLSGKYDTCFNFILNEYKSMYINFEGNRTLYVNPKNLKNFDAVKDSKSLSELKIDSNTTNEFDINIVKREWINHYLWITNFLNKR